MFDGRRPRVAGPLAVLGLALALAAPAGAASPPPANAEFDYQIGGDYALPAGVGVVSRDWFAGAGADGRLRHLLRQRVPDPGRRGGRGAARRALGVAARLVLSRLGDDPNWGGEYLIDICTAAQAQARGRGWVQPMIRTCASKGFDAVEYDNLDSWTRFDGTPRAGDVPFGKGDAIAYAELLAKRAHELGLAVGQKNTVELTRRQARPAIGFDFAIAEECGRWDECDGLPRRCTATTSSSSSTGGRTSARPAARSVRGSRSCCGTST